MSLKIIKAGILDSVQDMGRYGQQALGINPGGAMDKYALQVANVLAGNDPAEAAIEIHFPASVFMFRQPSLIALAGADFSASINGEPIPNLHGITVNKNDLLQFHQPVKGARAYLAVNGGFALTKWLDSYSTNLKAKAGGFDGRNLQKGDEIHFRNTSTSPWLHGKNAFDVLPWEADIKYLPAKQNEINDAAIFVLPGNEWERLTDPSKKDFFTMPFDVAPQSDRMGYRLYHEPLQTIDREEIVSSAVSGGTIQLLPEGKIIVLMADHQTTGGYPRIAHVITAHHSLLAQMKAGDQLYFRLTDQRTAEELLIKRQQHLLQLQNACTFRLQEYFGNDFE